MTKELALTTEIEQKLIQQLMAGVPLTKVCKDKSMPSLTKVYSWLAKHKEFSKNLQNARRIGAQSYIDKAIEDLDNADNRNIMVVREKASMARWMASKLIPIYGDKSLIQTDSKIEITWNVPDHKSIDVTPIHALVKANPDKSYKEVEEQLRSNSSVEAGHK